MRKHSVLYFSARPQHIIEFDNWAEQQCDLIKWYDKKLDIGEYLAPIDVTELPRIIGQQVDIDSLSVIIDYRSFGMEGSMLYDANEVIQRTILQYPEVDFFFDQSGEVEEKHTGIDFLFNDRVVEKFKIEEIKKDVVRLFHVFRRENGFVITKLDYDNLFDGSNIRCAIKRLYYHRLHATANFEKLQFGDNGRCHSMAVVIDDEPTQSRFNGFALFVSGYRVIPVHTARMLAVLNSCIEFWNELQTPKIIVRDFDLQFPDVKEHEDYNGSKFKGVPEIVGNAVEIKIPQNVKEVVISEKKKTEAGSLENNHFKEMIDYVRNYRYDKKNGWILSDEMNTIFWGAKLKKIKTYVVTNGHDLMDVKPTKYEKWKKHKNEWLQVCGILKPVSGLYHPFFSQFKDENNKHVIEKHFKLTRYIQYKDRDSACKYEIIKKRKDSNHGVPIDIYDTIKEMQQRAEEYYEKGKFIKSAVLAQEIIELLNGFHYQMMIRAYELKVKAENAISMDIIGADEKQLVLDAMKRIKIIKEDVHRMVFPLYKGEKNLLKDIELQYERRRKEHQILAHIFSDCRATCRENEYFEVESVFIREMAHLDEKALGLEDVINYIKHYRSVFSHENDKSSIY